jgi:hypothetical protein
MDMIHFIQKARQLKVLGFDSYQGIVATHGIDKADEILTYLLDASELGFNLNDLNAIFKNLNNIVSKKEEIVDNSFASLPLNSQTIDLWSLVKQRLNITFDVEQFVLAYENPSYPNSLEIEDFLMCIGVDLNNANSRMRGASRYLQKDMVDQGFNRFLYPTLTTVSPSSRQVFQKSRDSINSLLVLLKKFLLKEYTPMPQSFKTLNEWLNVKYTIERQGKAEQWFLPDIVYTELCALVNTLLIKYNIGGDDLLLKSYLSKEDFTPADALDVSKGFCEILYRDAVMTLYNRDISFTEIVQEFCAKKGIVYSKDFEGLVLVETANIKINNYDFKSFTMRSVRPFHQLVLFHLMEKLVDVKTKLKIDYDLFSKGG